MKTFFQKKINYFIFIGTFLYFFIISFLIIPVGDDFFWWGKPGHYLLTHNFFSSDPGVGGSSNGRYLGNLLEITIMHSPIIAGFLYATVISLFIWCLWKLSGKRLALVMALAFFVTTQMGYIQTVFLWFAGFINYLPPITALLLYFVLLEKYLRQNKIIFLPGYFLISVIGGLFVEHMTLYQIFVGILSILSIYLLNKRTSKHLSIMPAFLYSLGALCSAALMFSNPSYYHGSDYRTISPNPLTYIDNFVSITHFWMITFNYITIILICVAIILISLNKFKKTSSKSLSIIPAIFFIIYYLGINTYLDPTLKLKLTKNSIDSTLASTDSLIGLAFLIYLIICTLIIFRGLNNINVKFYLFSYFALCIPFFFITSPIFIREYFSSYVFLFIISIIYINKALAFKYHLTPKLLTRTLGIVVCLSYLVVMTMMLSNYQVNLKRVADDDFLYEEKTLKHKVPYPNYVASNDSLMMQSPMYWHNRLGFKFNDYFYNKKYK